MVLTFNSLRWGLISDDTGPGPPGVDRLDRLSKRPRLAYSCRREALLLVMHTVQNCFFPVHPGVSNLERFQCEKTTHNLRVVCGCVALEPLDNGLGLVSNGLGASPGECCRLRRPKTHASQGGLCLLKSNSTRKNFSVVGHCRTLGGPPVCVKNAGDVTCATCTVQEFKHYVIMLW